MMRGERVGRKLTVLQASGMPQAEGSAPGIEREVQLKRQGKGRGLKFERGSYWKHQKKKL